MEQALKEKIESLTNSADVVLFMKGTKEQPLCGFSAHATELLKMAGIDFADINILEDEELRQGLKEYANWPTYPQLWVKGELVGGVDIMQEMAEAGELKTLAK